VSEHDHSTHRRHQVRADEVEVNGRHVWLLRDEAGILEIADAERTLAEDHPAADIVGLTGDFSAG
jgi:hypothetical protein